jgi:sulfite reductase (ferredoxin)
MKMIEITEEILKSINDFEESAELCKNDKLDTAEYRRRIVAMGVYKQRVKGTYMVRLRATGGAINLKQLEVISKVSKVHGYGRIHLTTRQDIQLQALPMDNIKPIMEEVIKVDITTRGACGDTVRNVGCSPLSGVALDEVFDVTSYVKETINHLMKDPTAFKLPRKYKIAFSNNSKDTGNATMADLGFIAKVKDGVIGFEVYGGGGLGGGSRMALKLSDFIEDKDVLYYVQAMKEVFENEGDRTNRHKARIRHIVHRLGEEKFVELFNTQLEKVRAERKLESNINTVVDKVDVEAEEIKRGIEISNEYENILFTQKQLGCYAVYIHPHGGNLEAEDLDRIIAFLNNLDYETSIRLTTTQGFFVRDLKEKDARELIKTASNISSTYNIDNSVSCIGHTTCSLGLCLSQNLLEGIKKAFNNERKELKRALPKLFISGCPNSCGQHQQGMIGLSGRAKRTEDRLIPAYSVSFGGKLGAGIAKIGTVYGDIPAKKIPEFLLELAAFKVSSGYEDFEELLSNKSGEIKDLVNKYSFLESFNENPELYYDFGSDEKFAAKR